MNGKKTLISVMVIFAIGAFLPVVSFAAVTYFAECAWTDSDLVCFIYADTGPDSLISGGVTLSYSPVQLNDPIPADTTKNEGTWFFGKSTDKKDYMDPEIDTANKKVTVIVGKLELDASDQPTGVGANGTRVEIGRVKFTRKTNEDPWPNPADPSQPVTFFGLDLALGRGGNYVNFVNTEGDPLDSSATKGTIRAAERGDANADGFITNSDFFQVRNDIVNGSYRVYSDCNDDGFITNSDYFCIRNKL